MILEWGAFVCEAFGIRAIRVVRGSWWFPERGEPWCLEFTFRRGGEGTGSVPKALLVQLPVLLSG